MLHSKTRGTIQQEFILILVGSALIAGYVVFEEFFVKDVENWKPSFVILPEAFGDSLYKKRKVVEMKGDFTGENSKFGLTTKGTYTIGLYKLNMTNSGFYKVQEQQSNGPCKKIHGESYLLDNMGNGYKIKLEGKLCHMGQGIKQLNAWFDIVESYGNVKNSMQKQRGIINAFIDADEKIYDGFLRTKLIFLSI